MSRIGKMSIAVPAGVSLGYEDSVITVKGPKGTLTRKVASKAIEIKVEDGHITLTALDNATETGALHGLYRALIAGMVKGVSEGFTKSLEVKGIKLECPSPTDITVSGIDKVLVGQVAADLRAIRVPEPYHGYGIRYKGEHVEHKEGKTSGKGKK